MTVTAILILLCLILSLGFAFVWFISERPKTHWGALSLVLVTLYLVLTQLGAFR